MSDKKRTTVTTIETREVWIIRTAVPEPSDEPVTLTPPQEICRKRAIPPLADNNTANIETEEKTT